MIHDCRRPLRVDHPVITLRFSPRSATDIELILTRNHALGHVVPLAAHSFHGHRLGLIDCVWPRLRRYQRPTVGKSVQSPAARFRVRGLPGLTTMPSSQRSPAVFAVAIGNLPNPPPIAKSNLERLTIRELAPSRIAGCQLSGRMPRGLKHHGFHGRTAEKVGKSRDAATRSQDPRRHFDQSDRNLRFAATAAASADLPPR